MKSNLRVGGAPAVCAGKPNCRIFESQRGLDQMQEN